MTREQVAEKIRWPFVIWLAGLVNVGAMVPQLIEIIRIQKTEGLSLAMFAIYLVIQIAFSLQGFFRRDRVLMVCMALSACVSAVIIALILFLRHAS